MAESQPSNLESEEQSSHHPKLPCCHVCGTQLVLKGPPSKRRLNPICPNCGAKCELRCAWCKCKKLFLPTNYRLHDVNHFCCDEHAIHFGNERRYKKKSAERAAARAIPRQCARKGSILAPGVRENPELLEDCPVVFTPPKHNNQKFCSRECQRIQWWVENYDELSGEVKEKSRLQYEKRVELVKSAKEAEQKLADAEEAVNKSRAQLRVAEYALDRLRQEQQSPEERVFHAVKAAIPRIEALLSEPEIKQNPRLLRNWSNPRFSSDEIEGAYQASISRKPRAAWAFIGACWFVSLRLKYDVETVRKYYRLVDARASIQ